MFLVTINKGKRLLYLVYHGRVESAELRRARDESAAMLDDFEPGFRVLVDFERMESMSTNAAGEIGKLMELVEQRGVGLVVRVIPDASKDIGFNILAAFHYKKAVPTVTCESMQEAAKVLEL